MLSHTCQVRRQGTVGHDSSSIPGPYYTKILFRKASPAAEARRHDDREDPNELACQSSFRRCKARRSGVEKNAMPGAPTMAINTKKKRKTASVALSLSALTL